MAARPRLDSGPLTVRVAGGLVRGVAEPGVSAWRGIPYAAAPTGTLRFRAPRPVQRWEGVLDASRYGNVAPQLYRGQFRGTNPGIPSGEDCLSVNVYAPAERPIGRRLAVMVFIHGGGYSVGSSQDFPGQGESFAETGEVVYVSFNYRLGALGYLHFTRFSTRRRPIDCNIGLRDQVAALRWVHDNIGAFGGDPRNVTVFGQSAGANAVTTLMVTPSARGLFTRAIAQSPPPAAVYSRQQADRWAADYVAVLRTEAVKDSDGSPEVAGAAELLRTATVDQLNNAALVLQLRSPDDDPGTFCLAPMVDGDVVPERPMEAFRRGRAHRVPLVIGTTDREGALFRGRVDILPRTPARIRTIFERAPAPARALMSTAYPGLPAGRVAADFAGDYGFWYPSTVVADRHARFAPVHAYRFDTAPRLLHLLGFDATHGIDLFALFDQTGTALGRTVTAFGGREAFAHAGNRMRRHWLDFATTGTVSAEWPSYTAELRTTLIIDTEDRIEVDPRRNRRLAWSSFLPDM